AFRRALPRRRSRRGDRQRRHIHRRRHSRAGGIVCRGRGRQAPSRKQRHARLTGCKPGGNMNTHLRRALVAATFLASTAVSAHAQEEISVTLVNGHPPVFLWVKHLTETYIPTVDKALEGSGYSIAWSEAYGGTLAAVGGELEALEDGLAEVGVVPTVFEPTALPLQNVSYFTPFSTPDPRLVLETVNALHESVPGMIDSWERYDVEYLGGGFALDNYLLMTNFPVESIDDLSGRRIAAPGPAVNWLEGTGAVGVAGNLTTYYNDIQTGVFDGVIVFPTAAA